MILARQNVETGRIAMVLYDIFSIRSTLLGIFMELLKYSLPNFSFSRLLQTRNSLALSLIRFYVQKKENKLFSLTLEAVLAMLPLLYI